MGKNYIEILVKLRNVKKKIYKTPYIMYYFLLLNLNEKITSKIMDIVIPRNDFLKRGNSISFHFFSINDAK